MWFTSCLFDVFDTGTRDSDRASVWYNVSLCQFCESPLDFGITWIFLPSLKLNHKTTHCELWVWRDLGMSQYNNMVTNLLNIFFTWTENSLTWTLGVTCTKYCTCKYLYFKVIFLKYVAWYYEDTIFCVLVFLDKSVELGWSYGCILNILSDIY